MKAEHKQIKDALEAIAYNGPNGTPYGVHYDEPLKNLTSLVRQLFTLEHEAKQAQHHFDTGEIDFETAMSVRGRALSLRLILADVVGHEWPPED